MLKTTDSAFVGFVRDRYTTLPETNDRIFATVVTASWTYGPIVADWDSSHAKVRQTLLDVFATHKSRGVQETLYAMGEAVLATVSVVHGEILGEPSAELRANLADSELPQLFTPYESM